jgi:hypothetical protein
MTELEYREFDLRLKRVEQHAANEFVLGLYTDLVRQHIDLLKDLVHNRFSNEDYETYMRLERDVKILEKSLDILNGLLSRREASGVYNVEMKGAEIEIA